jgi:hypothetical protein
MCLAILEACLFAFVACLHFAFVWRTADTAYAAPVLYPAAIVEALLAFALFASVVWPGRGSIRAGHVLGAQLLCLLAIVVGRIALMRAPELASSRDDLVAGAVLILALASTAALASPAFRPRRATAP